MKKPISPLLVLMLAVMAASAPDMTIADVAAYLKITTRSVYTMLADGRLKGYKLGDRIIRFRKSEVDAALQPTGGAV